MTASCKRNAPTSISGAMIRVERERAAAAVPSAGAVALEMKPAGDVARDDDPRRAGVEQKVERLAVDDHPHVDAVLLERRG